jgi:hypothetical protein
VNKKDDELPDYKRPTMPFEEEASMGPGVGMWAAVGIEFGLYVVLFFLGGRWLDGKFGLEPWGAALGGLLGAVMGMYMLIRRVLRASENDTTGPGAPKGPGTGA